MPEALWATAIQFARRAHPMEACGLLLGHRGLTQIRVAELSLSPSPRPRQALGRFELDALHLVQSEDRARSRGMQLLGLWHSHPGGPAVPSAADLRGAVRGWSYVILGLGPGDRVERRSWHMTRAGMQPQEIRSLIR